MVLVTKAERRAIYAYLLREGVIVVRKDSYLPAHQHITEVSNLKVMMIVIRSCHYNAGFVLTVISALVGAPPPATQLFPIGSETLSYPPISCSKTISLVLANQQSTLF